MVCIRETKIFSHLFLARCMKTVAYLRISTGCQDLANQTLAVLDYPRQNRSPSTGSSRRKPPPGTAVMRPGID